MCTPSGMARNGGVKVNVYSGDRLSSSSLNVLPYPSQQRSQHRTVRVKQGAGVRGRKYITFDLRVVTEYNKKEINRDEDCGDIARHQSRLQVDIIIYVLRRRWQSWTML